MRFMPTFRMSNSKALPALALALGAAFFGAAAEGPAPTALEKLQQTLAELRGQVPGQSHTMIDVAQHFNGLWFAVRAKNWPLAGFYLDETKSHLRWSIRVKPVRKLANGTPLNLGEMLAGVEQGALKLLDDSIARQDQARFVSAYKTMLASCYACHVAAEFPFLRLRLPDRPVDPLIEFDPTKPGSPTD